MRRGRGCAKKGYCWVNGGGGLQPCGREPRGKRAVLTKESARTPRRDLEAHTDARRDLSWSAKSSSSRCLVLARLEPTRWSPLARGGPHPPGDQVGTGFGVICWFCRLRLSRFAFNFSTEIFTSSRSVPASECVLGIRSLFRDNFPVASASWNLNSDQHFLCVYSSKIVSDASNVSKSSRSAIIMSPFQIPPRDQLWQYFLATLMLVLLAKSDGLQPLLQKVLFAL